MSSEPTQILNKRLSQIVLLLLITLVTFSFFTPRALTYSDFTFIRLTAALMSLIGIPALVSIWLTLNNDSFKLSYIVIGFVVLFSVRLGKIYITNEDDSNFLNTNGVWGEAVVSKKRVTNTLGIKHNQVSCDYIANHKHYKTAYINDDKHLYKIGDTLPILYEKDFPECTG